MYSCEIREQVRREKAFQQAGRSLVFAALPWWPADREKRALGCVRCVSGAQAAAAAACIAPKPQMSRAGPPMPRADNADGRCRVWRQYSFFRSNCQRWRLARLFLFGALLCILSRISDRIFGPSMRSVSHMSHASSLASSVQKRVNKTNHLLCRR